MRAAALLAAGHSRRFGTADKLLAPLGGRPLVAHAAEAVTAAPVDLRLLVARDPEVARHCPGFTVVPPEPGEGVQADSLRAAVLAARTAGASGLLVALADMPRVTVAHLAAVMERGAAHGAACSGCGGRRMPPAWFGAAMFDELLTVSGDAGARSILRGLPPEAVVMALPGLLADIDTAADLATLGRPA